MATICLLVADSRNRELLADALGEEHHVLTVPPEQLEQTAIDLCLFDLETFSRHRDVLEARKAADEPVFLPYLLVAGRRGVDSLPPSIWGTVDEVIQTPIHPPELKQRLGNLVHRRRLSVELKQQQERSEARFRSLFDAAPDPIVVTDEDGHVTEVNDAFIALFERDQEDLIGRPVSELGFSPAASVDRILLRVDESPAEPEELRWVSEDDQLVVELKVDVVEKLGTVTDKIGIFRDLTDLKDYQRRLEEQNERLEGFARTIAHDLRNPLNVAQGRIDNLSRTTEDENVEEIEIALGRMQELIDEILTLARQGQTVIDPDVVSLGEVAHDAWSHVETREATFEVESTRDVEADPGRLSQLFENLFRNAIDHVGPEVTVRVGLLADGFFVGDDGPGIPADAVENVFDAGFTTASDGTGFGLSIVQQIAEAHGWDVSVTTGEDGGARFEVEDVESVGEE